MLKMMIATVLIAAIAVGALLWKRSAPDPKANVVDIARYVARSDFSDLSEEQKRPYMNALRFKIEKVNEAHAAGKLNDTQFKAANQYAWMARQLDHMDTYFALAPGAQRDAFLDKIIDKKVAAGAGKPKAEGMAKDEEFMSEWSQSWSSSRQAQFAVYRDALSARYKARGIVKK